MILIIGNSIDLAKSVTDEIECSSSEEVVFFKADQCLTGESISYSLIGDAFNLVLRADGRDINLTDVRSVWYWKPLLPKELRNLDPPTDQIFVYRQFLAMWRSLASLLADRIWVNEYYHMLAAEHKPYQLKTAAHLGFSVPETMVTSDPQKALDFWNFCKKEAIIKPLMSSPNDSYFLFANKITDELMDKAERIKSSPVILQRLIPAKNELRITVVGSQVFAAEIISESKLDWRRGKIEVRPFDLPEAIKDLCLKYVSNLGLLYGCIDMIVSLDGVYYFLEINPNGQWGFVEKRSGLPIGKAIAHLLMRR